MTKSLFVWVLNRFLGGYQTLKAVPWLWKLIINWRDVQKVLLSVKLVLDTAKDHGGLPTKVSVKELVGSLAIMFEKDLIDFEDLDEAKFAEMLRDIEINLDKALTQARVHSPVFGKGKQA